MAETLKGHPFGDAAASCPQTLKLGAVYPDVLFYLTGSLDTARYREIAQAYHGVQGEDTYALIRRTATSLTGSPYPEPLRAFLAGVACHVQTDMTFHPFVYHMTGNYDDADPARRSRSIKDNRRLECLLDLYFCEGSKNFGAYSLTDILIHLELPLIDLLEFLASSGADISEYPAMIPVTTQALRNFRILQRLFKRRGLTRFLDMITPCLPAMAQETATLFYSPALDIHLSRLNGKLPYQNP